MDKVKIAVDCRMITMSGIGVFLDNILVEWVQNHKYTFLLVGKREELVKYYEFSNCEVMECDIPIFSKKEFLGFPAKEINQCNIFYTPNYNIPGGIRIPIYSTVHDVVALDVEGITSKVGKIIRKWFVGRAIKKSEKVFTVSQFSRKRMEFFFNCKNKIIVVYNGVSHNIKQYKKITNKDNYFIYVGNIKKHKGLDVLLRAMDKYNKVYPRTKLYIVGKADNFKTSDTNVLNSIKDKNYVCFTGRINNEKLYDYLCRAKALIQPSRYEGFGIPPLEALYLGTKVIISDIDVFKEVYGDFPVAFFEDENSEDLLRAMTNIENFLAPNCIELIDEKYNYNNTAQQILNILTDNE